MLPGVCVCGGGRPPSQQEHPKLPLTVAAISSQRDFCSLESVTRNRTRWLPDSALGKTTPVQALMEGESELGKETLAGCSSTILLSNLLPALQPSSQSPEHCQLQSRSETHISHQTLAESSGKFQSTLGSIPINPSNFS